jgi:SSS family solute:Na+ symporter
MTPLDYFVLAGYFVLTIALGSLTFARQKGLQDYFVASHSTPWLASMASLVATTISAVTFIGIPALSFKKDLTDLQIYLGFPVAAIAAAVLIVPFYYRQDILTAYQFLERRFDLKTRLLASILFQLREIFVMGVVIAAPAKIMTEFSGLPFHWSALLVVLATTVYTVVGGIRAVIWTDVMQLIVLLGGPLAAMFILVQRMDGGIPQIIAIASAHDKFRIIDTSFDPRSEVTVWIAFSGLTLYWFSEWVISQSSIQRYLTGRSLAESQRALVASGFGAFFVWVFFFLIGIALYAFHIAHPERLPAGNDADRVFVRFILGELPGGLRGLALSGVFAAAMSTLSSRTNAIASLTLVDVLQPLVPDRLKGREVLWARWITVVWAAVGTLAALVVVRYEGIIKVGFRLGNLLIGPLLGVFLLGMFSHRTRANGAFLGCCVGVVAIGLVASLTEVSWGWYTLIGSLGTVLSGYLLSGGLPPGKAGTGKGTLLSKEPTVPAR